MKPPLALLCSLVLMLAFAVSTRAQTSPASSKPATKKAAPAKKAEAPPPKIDGIEISRGERGFLGVQMIEGNFKISFYDPNKKPVAADVARAVLRWDPKYKVGKEQVVLNRSDDGKSLVSPRNIRPPYNFKLIVTLIKEATDPDAGAAETVEGNETYVIDFRG